MKSLFLLNFFFFFFFLVTLIHIFCSKKYEKYSFKKISFWVLDKQSFRLLFIFLTSKNVIILAGTIKMCPYNKKKQRVKDVKFSSHIFLF